jgi:glycosyltransferase 2 family protein
MKHLGRLLALAGLLLALWLFLHEDAGAIWGLLRQAGAGLLLAGLFHVLPMLLNAWAWRAILPGALRPALGAMTWVVWIRESVNGLLPVARIGGELVSYRLLRRLGLRRAPAAASLVVDMALSILSQFAFALLGLGLLLASGSGGGLSRQLAVGLLLLAPLGIVFILVQRAGLFERLARLLDKLVAGRLAGAIEHSARIDRAIRLIYRRRGAIAACFLWQCAGWVAGAGEIWLALQFLGDPVGLLDALAIEALIQAVSSAAFIVPGALGVQEGGFILIGGALGLGAPVALALAAARRLRDLVVFFPGLLAWQWAEARAPIPVR